MKFWFWVFAVLAAGMALLAVMSALRQDWIDTGLNVAIMLADLYWARKYWLDMKIEQVQ